MCSAQVSEADRPAGLNAVPAWRVIEVKALPDFRLNVRFQDGTTGVVEMAGFVAGADAGVFASLRAPGQFDAVRVEHGAVTWPGDLDLAPDAMYAAIRKSGRWVLV